MDRPHFRPHFRRLAARRLVAGAGNDADPPATIGLETDD
jgi:hypothetical protein